MEKLDVIELTLVRTGMRRIQNEKIKLNKVFMGSRICDNCGKKKDTYGGKTCSHGHFICHSCASGHEHCPLCGHTLR